MAANKGAERFATFSLLMPTGVNISSGQPLLLGETGAMAGVAAEAQNTSNPVYDNNTGYLTVDFEGVYFLTVVAETLGTVSAGAAFKTGDKVYASGGTYDPTSGITYGFTLCNDSGGDFFGRILQPLAAGVTAIVPVLLRNAC
jgi:Uncharacterized conserved protein (DUF2190)